MSSKSNMDAFGATSLVLFALVLAVNQVAIKVSSDGLQPVFMAGARSFGAIFCVGGWMWFKGIAFDFKTARLAGLAMGTAFAIEFLFLFTALDLTSVARASVIFYSMPLWLALAAHFILGEHLHARKSIGLVAAFVGVALALSTGSQDGQGSLAGDIMALCAALLWAVIALLAKASKLNTVSPEMQLFWQVLVSAPILLGMALFFGPFVRELIPLHLWLLVFQTVIVVSAGFAMWFWLLRKYPASLVASFSFLAPIFGVALGGLLLGEEITATLITAMGLVAIGILLINLPKRS